MEASKVLGRVRLCQPCSKHDVGDPHRPVRQLGKDSHTAWLGESVEEDGAQFGIWAVHGSSLLGPDGAEGEALDEVAADR